MSWINFNNLKFLSLVIVHTITLLLNYVKLPDNKAVILATLLMALLLSPIAVRRRNLIAKIGEKIHLTTDKDYTPTQHKWITDGEGKQTKVEVAKLVKCWWTSSVDGKINLVVRYGSKPLSLLRVRLLLN